MKWVEKDLVELVWGYGVWFGGAWQLLVAIFEMLHGNLFGATAFGSYSAFWLGWAAMYIKARENTFKGPHHWQDGECAWRLAFGVLTIFFVIVTTKKNMCLFVTFSLLCVTFFLLAAGTYNENVLQVGGCFGFATALAAFYTAMAELINHEFGESLLPGLAPINLLGRGSQTLDTASRFKYDKPTNTVYVNLNGMQVTSKEQVMDFKTVFAGKFAEIGQKAHVVVNYSQWAVAPNMYGEWISMIGDLQQEWYLSVKRENFSAMMGPNSTDAPGMITSTGPPVGLPKPTEELVI